MQAIIASKKVEKSQIILRGPKTPYSSRAWLTLFLIIWAISLSFRLLFVYNALSQNSWQTVVNFHWDSREYLHLGKNLAERGQYEIDTPESRFFALLRTPGYPAFCAVFLKLGAGVPGVLYGQAALGSLIPVIAAMLAGAMFRSQSCAIIAGALSVFSTTGVGLGVILLSDLLFAVTISIGFALTYAAAAFGKRWAWLGAGLAFSAGLMIKPAIVYLGPVIALGWYLMSRSEGRPMDWRRLAYVVAMPLIAMGIWTAHNHAKTKYWVFSTMEAQNLRHFMAPLTEECAKAGRLPDDTSLTANHVHALLRDLEDMMAMRVTAVELAQRQKREAMAILRKSPGWAGAGLLNNSASCTLDGWAWTPLQLPKPGVMGRAMFALNRWQIDSRLLLLGLGLLVGLERIISLRAGAPNQVQRREWGAMGACAALLVYFFVISGTSFSTGFRIMYPVEFAMILLAIGGARACKRMLHAGAAAAEVPGTKARAAD